MKRQRKKPGKDSPAVLDMRKELYHTTSSSLEVSITYLFKVVADPVDPYPKQVSRKAAKAQKIQVEILAA